MRAAYQIATILAEVWYQSSFVGCQAARSLEGEKIVPAQFNTFVIVQQKAQGISDGGMTPGCFVTATHPKLCAPFLDFFAIFDAWSQIQEAIVTEIIPTAWRKCAQRKPKVVPFFGLRISVNRVASSIGERAN